MTYTIWTFPKNKNIYDEEVIKLTHIQKAASLCFIRRDRFVLGANYHDDLIELVNKFFGNAVVLIHSGLVEQYKNLKTYVVEKNLIGLILCGFNDQTRIGTYFTNTNTRIELTISSITRILIKDYFNEDDVNKYCEATPNFAIYYKDDKSDKDNNRERGDNFKLT
jgi:hypothetical protein